MTLPTPESSGRLQETAVLHVPNLLVTVICASATQTSATSNARRVLIRFITFILAFSRRLRTEGNSSLACGIFRDVGEGYPVAITFGATY